MKQQTVLYKSRLVIEAYRISIEIQMGMKNYTFDSKKMKAWQDLCDNFEQLSQRQFEAHTKAKTATQTIRSSRKQIHEVYSRHITLSRIAFRDKPEVLGLLGLDSKRSMDFTGWLKQAQNYYYFALTYAEALEQYGVLRQELEDNQEMLRQMIELLSLQKQAQSQEQVISQQKQQAYEVVRQWYAKFIKLARLAFEDNPQQLEAMGIVVKAKA